MPRGGARTGAGRKRKSALELAVTGNPGHRPGVVVQHPSSTAIAAVETIDPPADMPLEAKAVWAELAPHAATARTLVKATAPAFEMLCRNIVLERRLATSALAAGGSDHRGMIQRVSAGLKDFGLAPFGKAIHEGEEDDAATQSPLQQLLNRRKAAGA